MNQPEYISSARVIFSDRGSIYFGFLVIGFMLIVSLGLFVLKFQKKDTYPSFSKKIYREQMRSSLFLKHHFLFNPAQANYLLFFFNSKDAEKANFSLNQPQKEN